MGSHWGKGAYRPRSAKVSKFPTALDLSSGEYVPLKQLKAAFFTAANDDNPKAAIATLREKFKLACPHCRQAGLVFSFGSQNPDGTINSIAGSNIPGNPAHLKTKGGETHAPNCIGVVMTREGHEIDTEKGFRFHLNLKHIPERHPLSKQLLMREPGGKIVVLDPDLKDREPFGISKPKDMLPLMRSGQTARLNTSVIVYGDTKIPWSEFMIPATDSGDENPQLAQFARSFFKNNVGHPIMADLAFAKATSSRSYDDTFGNIRVYKFPRSAPIAIQGLGKIVIQPELVVQNEHLFDTTHKLQVHQGEALVVADHPVLYKRDSKTNIYMLRITLRDPDMMVESNLNDIMAIAAKRSTTKAAEPELLTPAHP